MPAHCPAGAVSTGTVGRQLRVRSGGGGGGESGPGTERGRAAKMEGNYSMRMHLRSRMRAGDFPLSGMLGGSTSVKKTKFDTVIFICLSL